jgi:hypothetical protein
MIPELRLNIIPLAVREHPRLLLYPPPAKHINNTYFYQ